MQQISDKFQSEQAKWEAVVAHDSNADGQFFYGVRTTGVYCRPSCAARRALRKNVEFFDNQSDAQNAGYRSCKRCKPDGPNLHERQSEAVVKACRLIEQAEEPLSLDRLARSVSLSPAHFHRVFKKVTGLTPKAYAVAYRNGKVKQELAQSENVTHAIYDAGYNSSGRFYASSSKVLGMKPSQYRRKGKGEQIAFSVGECSLGAILVATSEKGICAISIGDDPDQLTRELQDRFSNANIVGGNEGFDDLVARVVGLIDQPGADFDLPLDIRGTSFQQKVWKALTEIPYGSTASYTEIAEKIGSRDAVRAVAQACAANKLAVAIPCHRVVRRDGAISGYRWGVERKKKILALEAAQ